MLENRIDFNFSKWNDCDGKGWMKSKGLGFEGHDRHNIPDWSGDRAFTAMATASATHRWQTNGTCHGES